MGTNQNPATDSSNLTNDFADVSRPPAEELSEEELRQIAGGIVGSDGGVADAADNNEDGRVDV
jgi:bacteriocin-like protein